MAEIVSARATAASRPGSGRVWEGEGMRERSQGREEETTGELEGEAVHCQGNEGGGWTAMRSEPQLGKFWTPAKARGG